MGLIISQQEEACETWRNAASFARSYAKLRHQERASIKGFDPESASLASHGGYHRERTPLDGAGELEAILRYMRTAKEDLQRERPDVAPKYWNIWMSVRVEGESASKGLEGYGKSRTYTILAIVDGYVEEVLDWFDVLEIEPARPSVSVAINPRAFDDDE